MEKDIMLTVIVPVYNAEKYLDDCLSSLVNQSYSNIEILVIDDGSQDKSAEICDKYQADNNTVRVIHKENGGVAVARNLGLAEAKGKYITFVDADDWIDLNTYEVCFSHMDCEYDMILYRYQDEFGQKNKDNTALVDSYKVLKGNIYDHFMDGEYLGGFIWNKIWHRDVIAGLLFRTDILITEDAAFVWDSLANVKKVICFDAKMYHYRYIFSSMTKNSATERVRKALQTWDILYDAAESMHSSSIKGIARNKISWTIKYAQTLLDGDKEKRTEVYPFIRNNIKCVQEYLPYLDRIHQILAKSLLKSWLLFSFECHVLTQLKKIYIALKTNR